MSSSDVDRMFEFIVNADKGTPIWFMIFDLSGESETGFGTICKHSISRSDRRVKTLGIFPAISA